MPRVVVVGGGYGGITVAKALDPVAQVVLIDQGDRFVHNVAALRAAVEEGWEDSLFLPYDRLLQRGRVIQGQVEKVDGLSVDVAGGPTFEADYLVLATGSGYPFPAGHALTDHSHSLRQLCQLQGELARASRVLIVGGGTVGLELAGEILDAYPDATVTIVEREDLILNEPGISAQLRESILGQLSEMGVQLLTGAPLRHRPPTPPGVVQPFTVETTAGTPVQADIWFQCHGSHINSGYLQGTPYERVLGGGGAVMVEPTLQVAGFDRTYAVGDIADVAEPKRAHAAYRQARVAVANIAEQIDGRAPSHVYSPPQESVVIPLGSHFGASQLLDSQGSMRVVGAEPTSDLKGLDLLVPVIRSQLNLPSLSR